MEGNRLVLRVLLAASVWVWASASIGQAAQSLTIGEHAALPGGDVRVPVTMADATGLAAAAFLVNFDSELLALTDVTKGGLGEAFALEYRIEEGRVCAALVRDDALASGSGTLVYLKFRVNSGAVAGMTSPLAFADRAASGQYAVDLSCKQSVSHSNGLVRIVSLTQDSNSDGLPDWWEELYFEGPTNANAALDSDGDGMTNCEEYLAGTDPLDPANLLRVTAAAFEPDGFKLLFRTVDGVLYRVMRSDDLNSWTALGPDILGTGAVRQIMDHDTTNAAVRFYRIQAIR
jgi:hypothetical protein